MKVLHPRLAFHPLYLICSLQSSLLLGPLSCSPQLSLFLALCPASLSFPCFLALCPGYWVLYLGSLVCSPQSSLLLGPLSWVLGSLSWVLDLQPSAILVSWPSVLDPGSPILGPWSAALSLPCFLALCSESWIHGPVLYISSNLPTSQCLTRKYFVHNSYQPCITNKNRFVIKFGLKKDTYMYCGNFTAL